MLHLQNSSKMKKMSIQNNLKIQKRQLKYLVKNIIYITILNKDLPFFSPVQRLTVVSFCNNCEKPEKKS